MDRDYRGREGEPGIAAAIVTGDKADILTCRVMLLYFDRPSVGTAMEALFAWENGIAVHVVNASWKALSPWLAYHAHRQYETLDDALRFLRGGAA